MSTLETKSALLKTIANEHHDKVEETVEGIKAVPRNAQAAAQRKADDVLASIKNIPDTLAEAAKVKIDWLIDLI